jgi:hypothetical protein
LLGVALLGSLLAAGFLVLQVGTLGHQLADADQATAAALEQQKQSAATTIAGLRENLGELKQKAQEAETMAETLQKRLAETEEKFARQEQQPKQAVAQAEAPSKQPATTEAKPNIPAVKKDEGKQSLADVEQKAREAGNQANKEPPLPADPPKVAKSDPPMASASGNDHTVWKGTFQTDAGIQKVTLWVSKDRNTVQRMIFLVEFTTPGALHLASIPFQNVSVKNGAFGVADLQGTVVAGRFSGPTMAEGEATLMVRVGINGQATLSGRWTATMQP